MDAWRASPLKKCSTRWARSAIFTRSDEGYFLWETVEIQFFHTLSALAAPLSDATPNFQLEFEGDPQFGVRRFISALVFQRQPAPGFRNDTAWPLSARLGKLKHCRN